MREDVEARRRRLRFQSRRCGTKETSTVLGGFAERHIGELSEAQIDRFEALLRENDADLLAWLMGWAALPARHDNDVLKLIFDYRNSLSLH